MSGTHINVCVWWFIVVCLEAFCSGVSVHLVTAASGPIHGWCRRKMDISDAVTPHENRRLQLIIHSGNMRDISMIITRGFRYKYMVFHNVC